MDAIIGQWATERPDLQTEPMEIFGRIYRIAHLQSVRMERIYARFGINRGEFDVLATLRRSGEPYALSPSQLSATLMLTTGGMTGRLDKLERADLVQRIPDPADRRGLRVRLTDHGRQIIDEAVAVGLEEQRAALSKVPQEQRAQLAEMLRVLLSGVDS